MKIVYVGLILLSTLTLACAVTGNSSTDFETKQAAHQSGQASDGQISNPAPAESGQSAAFLSRAEADSMRVRGDSLLAQSGVSEIQVGSIGGNEVIYILLVVLLVAVILAVAH